MADIWYPVQTKRWLLSRQRSPNHSSMSPNRSRRNPRTEINSRGVRLSWVAVTCDIDVSRLLLRCSCTMKTNSWRRSRFTYDVRPRIWSLFLDSIFNDAVPTRNTVNGCSKQRRQGQGGHTHVSPIHSEPSSSPQGSSSILSTDFSRSDSKHSLSHQHFNFPIGQFINVPRVSKTAMGSYKWLSISSKWSVLVFSRLFKANKRSRSFLRACTSSSACVRVHVSPVSPAKNLGA